MSKPLKIRVYPVIGGTLTSPYTESRSAADGERHIREMFDRGCLCWDPPKIPYRAELLAGGEVVYAMSNPLGTEAAMAINNNRIRNDASHACRVCGEPNHAACGSCTLCNTPAPIERRAADMPTHNRGDVRVLFLPDIHGNEAYLVAAEYRHAVASGWSRIAQYTSDDILAIMHVYNALLLNVCETAMAEPDPTEEVFRAGAWETISKAQKTGS